MKRPRRNGCSGHRVAAVLLFLLLFPLLMPYQALAVNILVFGLYRRGLQSPVRLHRTAVSFGHAAFLGVGSYLTGISHGPHGGVALAAGTADRRGQSAVAGRAW